MDKIRKSVIISFAGWASLFLVGLGFGDLLIGGFTLPHNPPFGAAIAVLCVLFSFPLFVVWAIGTISHKVFLNRMQIISRMNALSLEAERHKAETAMTQPETWMPKRPAGGR